MQSLNELPPQWSSNELPNFIFKSVEFKCTPPSVEFNQSPHCDSQKCEVHLNSPSCFYKMWSLLELSTLFLQHMEFKWTPPFVESARTSCKMQSSNELPTVFLKMRSLFRVPTLFLKRAESAWPLHWVFEKCGVHTNSPLYGVRLDCHLVFKKCGVQTNSPLYF